VSDDVFESAGRRWWLEWQRAMMERARDVLKDDRRQEPNRPLILTIDQLRNF
jgi:hypothetical protein